MQVGTKDLLEFRGEDKVFCIVISLLHICMMILATLKVWPADVWKAAYDDDYYDFDDYDDE